MNAFRIGYGFDAHRLSAKGPLVVGGVEIPHGRGLAGHSDADVLVHAVCDALLGASALGDIGKHFPDSDESYKDIDSRTLLVRCRRIVEEKGYKVGNIDATVVAQEPKLAPYIGQMRENLASDLDVEPGAVSVKATTTEGMGFEGKGEGISVSAVALIHKA